MMRYTCHLCGAWYDHDPGTCTNFVLRDNAAAVCGGREFAAAGSGHPPAAEQACECGSGATTGPAHSHWCPRYSK